MWVGGRLHTCIFVKAVKYLSCSALGFIPFRSFSFRAAVMLFSRLFLRARYKGGHICGVAFCLLGLALTVLSDVREHNAEDDQSRAVAGDLLCILGAALYAGANVMQENFVKNHDRVRR